jgi:Ca2+-binding RTX toxin-like protein
MDALSRTLPPVAILCVLVVLAAAAPYSAAKRFTGSSRADRVVGTKRADVIRLKGGNDRARGKGGADRIYGGAGKDRLFGDQGADRLAGGSGADTLSGAGGKDRLIAGKGKDRLRGGAGNDVLNSVDRSRDRRVDGGAGKNTCVIDSLDLPVISRCGKVTVRNVSKGGGTPGGGGSGGGGGQGGGPGGGTSDSLTLSDASGLICTTPLPACAGTFGLSGSGARSQVVTVTGTGGVSAAGTGPVASDGTWTTSGGYSCTSDGFLVVSDGPQQFQVPVTCLVNQ